jgi:hypothetical protein
VVISGAPRSGTSMLAEAFVRAGHRPGDRLIPPSPANPKGFFEDLDVNVANDDVLATLCTTDGSQRPPRHLWWLGAFVGPAAPGAHAAGAERRARLVPEEPFVLKDPRFSHTMPSWPTLQSAVRIVMVRSPDEVAASLRAMDAVVRSTPRFEASVAHCAAMWSATYRSILAWCDDDTVFVEPDAVRSGAALPYLSSLTGADLGADHVAAELHRQRSPDATCGVERSVYDAVRDRLTRHEFNRELG